jgi:hypothetical protein
MWARIIIRSKSLRRVIRHVLAALLLAIATEIGARRTPKR